MFVDFIFLMSHEVVRNLSAHGIFAFTLTFFTEESCDLRCGKDCRGSRRLLRSNETPESLVFGSLLKANGQKAALL